jgi:hypothetical protein
MRAIDAPELKIHARVSFICDNLAQDTVGAVARNGEDGPVLACSNYGMAW